MVNFTNLMVVIMVMTIKINEVINIVIINIIRQAIK